LVEEGKKELTEIEKIIKMAQQKHREGQIEHGLGTWKQINIIDEMISELLDLINYCCLQIIKLTEKKGSG